MGPLAAGMAAVMWAAPTFPVAAWEVVKVALLGVGTEAAREAALLV